MFQGREDEIGSLKEAGGPWLDTWPCFVFFPPMLSDATIVAQVSHLSVSHDGSPLARC